MPQDKHVPGSSEDWLARAIGDLALARVPLPARNFTNQKEGKSC